jgi:protoheme IX farnesyltransferase
MTNRTQAQTFLRGAAAAPEPLAAPAVSWRSYIPLTKPTISLLVVVTVVPALLLAAHGMPKLIVALAALAGTYLASASASVFNHLLDADLDAVMNRTRGRPVPSGQVSTGAAFAFGSGLGITSLVVLGHFTTPLAAAVALAANAFYVLVYTLCLKRHTDQNIVIGGAAGSVGPLIGWAAVTGGLGWPAWVLFGIIFLWTPPHFWSLAIKYKRDYAAAGIPMLPVSRGEAATRRQIFAYTLTLIPPVIALYGGGAGGLLYLVTGLGATLYFAWKAWELLRAGDGANSMPVFHYSCLYLFIVFGSLTIDRLLAVIL